LRLAFVYLPGRRERVAQLAAGEVPSEFFYGATELAAAGHTVEHFEIPAAPSSPVLAGALDLLRRGCLTPPKVSGSAVVNAWALCPTLNTFDCVIATVGQHGFALAGCALFGRLQAPIVAIQCGLLHHPYSALRRGVTRALLNRMESVLFGEAEYQPMLARLAPEPTRLAVNQFGVDVEFWKPNGPREEYVLAIGNDPRRDYATLLAAAPKIAAPIRIVTQLTLPEPLPPNVTVLRGSWHNRSLSDADIRQLYQRAACVVVPLRDTLQPSGQSVTLQAMACGAPVVLTQTGGLWNAAALSESKAIKLIPPSNPTALASAVSAVLEDPERAAATGKAGRAHTLAHGNIRDFAAGIEKACIRAIDRSRAAS
jgi:hypothetical protein